MGGERARTGLTTAERANVIGQLSAFGVSATQIARRTRATKTEVSAALAVHSSELARAATARYDFLDLTQAAVLAEFDTDSEAVKALVVAAREGRFDHVAQRLRDERRDAAARAAVADGLREHGVGVIDRPAHGDTAGQLHRLTDVEGARLTAATRESCPGHVAYVGQEHGWVIVDHEGQPQPKPPADGDDQNDHPDEVKAGGEGPRREWTSWAAPRWMCTDPAAHGHTDTWANRRSSGSGGRVPVDQLDDEHREAARAARRDVIESNKAWGSAQTVRREWWALLLDFDLTTRVVAVTRPADEPQRWMLADQRAPRITTQTDNLWLRILDVPTALSARAYEVDETQTFTVPADAMCPSNAGTWRFDTRGATAPCTRVDEDPVLTLDIAALRALHLGGKLPALLASAGLLPPHAPRSLTESDAVAAAGADSPPQ